MQVMKLSTSTMYEAGIERKYPLQIRTQNFFKIFKNMNISFYDSDSSSDNSNTQDTMILPRLNLSRLFG